MLPSLSRNKVPTDLFFFFAKGAQGRLWLLTSFSFSPGPRSSRSTAVGHSPIAFGYRPNKTECAADRTLAFFFFFFEIMGRSGGDGGAFLTLLVRFRSCCVSR